MLQGVDCCAGKASVLGTEFPEVEEPKALFGVGYEGVGWLFINLCGSGLGEKYGVGLC